MSVSRAGSVYSVVQKYWTEKCLQCFTKVSSALSEKWLAVVKEKYSEPQRHYHTLKHVADMLNDFQVYEHHLKESRLVIMAIIFHDVIYNPQAGDNEEKSADLFAECAAEMSLEPSSKEKVVNLILKTKTHKTAEHTTPGAIGGDDVHFLLDLDMAILGSQPTDYDTYAAQIRQEYIHIPEEIYRVKRAQVLETFLQQANIYATAELRAKLESQARHNIQQEIKHLTGAGTSGE